MGEPDGAQSLAQFIRLHPALTILSGAGVSTASGIPDYRDDAGNWKHRKPMLYQDFVDRTDNRRRYWARSFSGWQRFAVAKPNPAHVALAALEDHGLVRCIITQNVDNLHRVAGSSNVTDLHGALHRVRCLGCDAVTARQDFQVLLERKNPRWHARISGIAPDGDARISRQDYSQFCVPDCTRCGGIMKPDVVFFGERVPAARVLQAKTQIRNSDALLIVGSSLMVFSGYRFAREADAASIPIAIVNRGLTRADGLASLRITGECTDILPRAVSLLIRQGVHESQGAPYPSR